VTFAEARRPLDALRSVPTDRLMVETDAPDQAPHPHRGQRSEPAYLPLIIEAMATARQSSVDELRPVLRANTLRLFPAFQRPASSAIGLPALDLR
jgi:TatD DNase family protein